MFITGILEDWIVQTVNEKAVIIGRIQNDIRGRFPDGSMIRTSLVEDRRYSENEVISTQNSTYVLGKRMAIN